MAVSHATSEGVVHTTRPTRIADVIPSVASGGLAVALGVLAAATSTDGVNAALQLLWHWTGGITGADDNMQRLKGTFVLSHLLQRHAKAGLLDVTSVRLLLYMCGLWDGGVVPRSAAAVMSAGGSSTTPGRKEAPPPIVRGTSSVGPAMASGGAGVPASRTCTAWCCCCPCKCMCHAVVRLCATVVLLRSLVFFSTAFGAQCV
jgi:hypothetical protein